MRDYEFKFGYIEIQVTPGFSNKAIELVFGDSFWKISEEKELSWNGVISECIRQLEQW